MLQDSFELFMEANFWVNMDTFWNQEQSSFIM